MSEEQEGRIEQWSWKAAAYFMRFSHSNNPVETERNLAGAFLGAMARGITEGYELYQRIPDAGEHERQRLVAAVERVKAKVQKTQQSPDNS